MATREQAEKVKDLLMDIMCLYRTTGPVFYHRVGLGVVENAYNYQDHYQLFVWVSGNKCDLPNEIDGVKIEYEWCNYDQKLIKEKNDLPNTVPA